MDTFGKRMTDKYQLVNPDGWYGFDGIPKGWEPLIEKLIQDLIAIGWDKEIHQCKSKLGGLRFYTGQTNEPMNALINEAANKSFKTCEICGEPGSTKNHSGKGYWLFTLCDKHRARQDEIVNSGEYAGKIYEEESK